MTTSLDTDQTNRDSRRLKYYIENNRNNRTLILSVAGI